MLLIVLVVLLRAKIQIKNAILFMLNNIVIGSVVCLILYLNQKIELIRNGNLLSKMGINRKNKVLLLNKSFLLEVIFL